MMAMGVGGFETPSRSGVLTGLVAEIELDA
jgi:hypothetical protein